MRIDLTNSAANQISTEPGSTQQVSTQKPALSSLPGSEDRTTLSSDTASVSSLVNVAMQSPEIRQDKVASLQQSIANGTYQLDPAKIAASMIDEHA